MLHIRVTGDSELSVCESARVFVCVGVCVCPVMDWHLSRD